jgi:DNA-binding NarL/FixJ family response regulator
VSTIRLLIADDEPLQRSGWRLLLESQPDFEVVAEANDGVHALSLLRTNEVDVVLADVQMPRLGGLDVAERIGTDARVRLSHRARLPRVVLMTAVDLELIAPLGLAAGGDVVLYKDVPPEELFTALRAAAARRPSEV